ncbi:hypothetical protein, partial [Alistipes finegoldii]
QSSALSPELPCCRNRPAVVCFIAGTALLSEPSSSRLFYCRNCLIVGTVHLSVVFLPDCPVVGCLAVEIFPPPEKANPGLSLRKTGMFLLRQPSLQNGTAAAE